MVLISALIDSRVEELRKPRNTCDCGKACFPEAVEDVECGRPLAGEELPFRS